MERDRIITNIVDIVLESNDLIMRQAEERQVLFKQIVKTLENDPNTTKNQQEEILEDLKTIENGPGNEFYKLTKLTILNSNLAELDEKEARRDELVDKIMHEDANLSSRDELVEILEEYCEMEEASIYRLVDEYAHAQDVMENLKDKIETFEILSDSDPRFKALQILKSHDYGISMTQLSFMIGTSQFQTSKIIRELESLDLVERRNSLLRATEQIDVAIPNGFDEKPTPVLKY